MKICRQIVAESDGWNWKDDPMAFRQGLLLKDMSSTPPEGKFFPWFLLICGANESGFILDLLVKCY